MKAKLGFFCYFLAVIFIIWALPIQEPALSNSQQLQILFSFHATDAYQVLSEITYYCFDYFSLMLPLHGLLNLNSFLRIRLNSVSIYNRFCLYFKYFYPYFFAVLVVKIIGLTLVFDGMVVIKIVLFLILWWALLLILSKKQLTRSYSTAIISLSLIIFRFLVNLF